VVEIVEFEPKNPDDPPDGFDLIRRTDGYLRLQTEAIAMVNEE